MVRVFCWLSILVNLSSVGMLSVGLTTVGLGDEFPQFRGAGGSGRVPSQAIPLRWSNDENLAWKIQVPGAGWSQPVVWGDKLFVTSAVSDKELRPKNSTDGSKSPQSMGLGGFYKAPDVEMQWQVLCYDATSGDKVWSQVVTQGKPQFAIHPSNTYATETPVVDAERIYAFFGASGTIAAFNHGGELLWKQELGAFPTSNSFGTGSSLAIYQSHVFVQNYTQKSGDLLCLNASNGETVWKAVRNKQETTWSSPIVWQNDQRAELIVSGGERMESFAPLTGEKLWELSNVKAATACSIASDSQRLYFGGSDPFSTGPLFALKFGGSGDLSPKSKNAEFAFCDWQEKQAGPGMASPVSTGSLVYVADNNILRCYNAATGERHYQMRLPKMKLVNASPLVIGDKVLLIDEAGTSALVKVGVEFEVVGGGYLNDIFWATPAVANNAIYFRGVDALYCVRETSLNTR